MDIIVIAKRRKRAPKLAWAEKMSAQICGGETRELRRSSRVPRAHERPPKLYGTVHSGSAVRRLHNTKLADASIDDSNNDQRKFCKLSALLSPNAASRKWSEL